ncbi:MAG: TonB-dependent receptor [Candidatus Omnitrophota bacterium]|nr:TonB-dependent receptor [Candidatus Omnitrophota bacterium]
MPILRIFIIILNFAICLSCFAEEDYATLEKIVITAESTESESQSYPSETFSSADINDKKINSVPDAFRHASGVDLRYRGTSGVQGDASIRGSTYEQVAISIDGIKINDPQTGHHNLDIPLTSFDIERMDILKQGASSFYGAGALSGGINIVSKKPLKKSTELTAMGGQHALFGQGFSFCMPGKDLSSSFSFEHKTTNGARPNTDFDYETYSCILTKDWRDNSMDFVAGYQDKEFGADSFYSNLYKEEEEHTKTLFLKTGLDTDLSSCNLNNSIFLRRHHDKFILNRNNPSFSQNTHTTYSYGIHSGAVWPVKYGDIETGFEISRDTIDSTKLGKNTRMNEALFLGFRPETGSRIEPDARFRIDHFQNWSFQKSSNLGLGYWLIEDSLKIKSSYSRSFRGPSFTELYYSDAANKGDSDLKVEKSDNYNAGVEAKLYDIKVECSGFLRKVKNTIDYTRPTANDVWQATNLGNVDYKGVEFRAGPLSYTYIEADRNNSGYLSKYALDILKHQLMLNLNHDIEGVKINWFLSYSERKFGETYFKGDVAVSKTFKQKDSEIEPFLKIDNFTDTEYSEISGVTQPGRWTQAGIRLKW